MFARKQPKAVGEEEALQKLATLCAQAEHSSGEMRERMQRWLLPAEVQDRILEKLIEERFVDDERFARLFVRDKLRFDRWGQRKLEQALRKKGVARNIIAQTLEAVPVADYVAALRPLLDSKRTTVKASSDYERNQKLLRFALSRGFTFDIIRLCLDGAGEVEVPDDEVEEFL